jgi:hypothetical protein
MSGKESIYPEGAGDKDAADHRSAGGAKKGLKGKRASSRG